MIFKIERIKLNILFYNLTFCKKIKTVLIRETGVMSRIASNKQNDTSIKRMTLSYTLK